MGSATVDLPDCAFATEFEAETDRDGIVHLTFVVFEPDGLGAIVRRIVDKKQMPAAGYARSVNGGSLACVRSCERRLAPLENRPDKTFARA